MLFTGCKPTPNSLVGTTVPAVRDRRAIYHETLEAESDGADETPLSFAANPHVVCRWQSVPTTISEIFTGRPLRGCNFSGTWKYRRVEGCMHYLRLYRRVVVPVVLAAVAVLPVFAPTSVQAASTDLAAETRLIDHPLSLASDAFELAAATGAGMVDRLTKVFSRISEVKLPTAPRAALDKPVRLSAVWSISPCFDPHTVALQVKVAF